MTNGFIFKVRNCNCTLRNASRTYFVRASCINNNCNTNNNSCNNKPKRIPSQWLRPRCACSRVNTHSSNSKHCPLSSGSRRPIRPSTAVTSRHRPRRWPRARRRISTPITCSRARSPTRPGQVRAWAAAAAAAARWWAPQRLAQINRTSSMVVAAVAVMRRSHRRRPHAAN